jgi:hypothetical protein
MNITSSATRLLSFDELGTVAGGATDQPVTVQKAIDKAIATIMAALLNSVRSP